MTNRQYLNNNEPQLRATICCNGIQKSLFYVYMTRNRVRPC